MAPDIVPAVHQDRPSRARFLPRHDPPGGYEVIFEFLDRYRLWVFGGILLLYLLGWNGQWRLGRDSTLFASIAAAYLQTGEWTEVSGLPTAEPLGLPLLIAASFRLFGVGDMTLALSIIFLLGLASVFLWYQIAQMALDRPRAVAFALLLAVSSVWYRLSFEVLTDLPFAAGLALSLWGYQRLLRHRPRRWLAALGLGVGVLVMASTRSAFLNVVVAAAITALLHLAFHRPRPRPAIIALGLSACGGGLLLLRAIRDGFANPLRLNAEELHVIERFTRRLAFTRDQFLTRNIPDMFTEALPEAALGVELPGLLGVLFSLLLFAGVALLFRRGLVGGVLAGVLALTFFLQTLIILPQARYFVGVVPLFLLGWFLLADRLSRRLPAPFSGWIPVAMLLLWLAPNLGRTAAFIHEQHREPFLEHLDAGQYPPILHLARQARAQLEPDAFVITDEAGAFHFFSGLQTENTPHIVAWANGDWEAVREILRQREPVYLLEPARPRQRELVQRARLQTGPPALAVEHDGVLWRLTPVWPGDVPSRQPSVE